MTAKEKARLLSFVARQSLRSYTNLSPADRITLLKGIALILPKAEAVIAAHTAFCLEQAEQAQFKLFESIAAQPQPLTI